MFQAVRIGQFCCHFAKLSCGLSPFAFIREDCVDPQLQDAKSCEIAPCPVLVSGDASPTSHKNKSNCQSSSGLKSDRSPGEEQVLFCPDSDACQSCSRCTVSWVIGRFGHFVRSLVEAGFLQMTKIVLLVFTQCCFRKFLFRQHARCLQPGGKGMYFRRNKKQFIWLRTPAADADAFQQQSHTHFSSQLIRPCY